MTELPECEDNNKPAIRVVTKVVEDDKQPVTTTKNKPNHRKTIKQSEQRNVTIFCQCRDYPHYWDIRANWTEIDEENDSLQQFYSCVQVSKSNHERAELMKKI